MSPYPAQIDREAVIATAHRMIEAEGVENLSLARLAAALDVRAPSLYRHFDGRAALLRAVNLRTNQALVGALRAAVESADGGPQARLLAMAGAYRGFAHAHPVTYGLAFASLSPELRPDPAQLEALALPLQALMAEVCGPAEALAALRGLWALVHGFVMLELNGQFQRGGDLDAAFVRAVRAYLAGAA